MNTFLLDYVTFKLYIISINICALPVIFDKSWKCIIFAVKINI